MATIVASRFAVLSIDDDDDVSVKKKKPPNKKPQETKPQNNAAVKSNGSQKKKKKQEVTQPQSTKNSKPNSVNAPKKKKKPAPVQQNEQKQKQKPKNPEYVEGNFEEDLSRAIYLSKLDYEQKKDVNGAVAKNDKNKKPNAKKNKPNQKVMTQNEMNGPESKNSKKGSSDASKNKGFDKDAQFFAGLGNDFKNDLSKEQLRELKRVKDLNSQESLTLVLYKAYIEKRDREIEQLKEEIERLNTNLKNVKIRNTKLCQVIANGEMKDKAEVLMEVARLQTIKDELSSEVASLHIQLEQERSKVRQLAAEHKNKEKSRKHHFSSGESQ